MKCIIFEKPDGKVDLVHQLGAKFLARFDGDRDAALQHEMARLLQDMPAGTTANIDDVEIPSDRTFRNAWKPKPGKLEVDMDEAREIQRDRMRTVRGPKLTALDVDYIRADEAGSESTKKKIASRKQQLRDVTKDPAIDSATTPEELKQVWPAILDED